MATGTALLDVLSSFTSATESTIQGLPDGDTLLPPGNGISLLDTKNEIFLSYLQALALRNLNVIRSLEEGGSLDATLKLSNDITSKLVENRVYLERGVRPLEQKIKYQVDKAVKAAEDEDRASVQKAKRIAAVNTGGGDDRDSEEDSDDTDDSEDGNAVAGNFHRPNPASLTQSSTANHQDDRLAKSKADGIYRPPRISATAMPTPDQRQRKERKPGRSATLDEYVSTELSTAPLAEPSIGSTIAAGGRTNKDTRQLAKEQERRRYEETNLVRLPKESNKARGKQSSRDPSGGFGGEEWRGLSASVDRIGDLTKRKGKVSALDQSRKRRAVDDGPRNDGIGDAFDVKKRRALKKIRR